MSGPVVNEDEGLSTAPVRVSVRVSLPPPEAFRLFTENMIDWWPVPTHSIGKESVVAIRFDARAGGELVEVCADGSSNHWADVLVFEPGARVVLAWAPGSGPGSAPGPSTEVEITFTLEDDGTRVAVEHREWQRLGERAASARASYLTGWASVLNRYGESARALAP